MRTVEKLIAVKQDDPEMAIRARAFNILIVAFWGLMLIISVLILLHWALAPCCSYGATTVAALILVNIMLPVSFAHSKVGYFRGAVWVFLAMLFAGTFIAQIGRGNSNTIILIYPIAIITAGLMLGLKSTIASLGISIVTFLSASAVIERYGPYLEYESETLALNNAMAVVASLIVITLITWLFTRNTREYIRQLEVSNREKEVLLKEIHHRVKNNLQMVSSLLNLQCEVISDAQSREMLRESVSRVKSMALVHEMLYSSKNISEIELKGYVDRLLGHIAQTQRGTMGIEFKGDVDDALLDVEATLSIGLIVNELVTNSVKHAFKLARENVNPTITVKFRKGIDHMELTVSDNGNGIRDIKSLESTQSFGMQIVNTLVEEMKGDMQIDGSDGTSVRMRFRHGR